jgi:hypothetical protein
MVLTTILVARQRRNPMEKFTLPTAWIWVGVAIFILFGIVRNLPGVALSGPPDCNARLRWRKVGPNSTAHSIIQHGHV